MKMSYFLPIIFVLTMCASFNASASMYLNDSNFSNSVNNGIVVVDFWAPWCGPCKGFASTFEGVESEQQVGIKFAKVNIDEAPNTAKNFNVTSIPTIIVFKNGKEVKRNVGPMSMHDFRQFVKN